MYNITITYLLLLLHRIVCTATRRTMRVRRRPCSDGREIYCSTSARLDCITASLTRPTHCRDLPRDALLQWSYHLDARARERDHYNRGLYSATSAIRHAMYCCGPSDGDETRVWLRPKRDCNKREANIHNKKQNKTHVVLQIYCIHIYVIHRY